jgi:heat shock protein HtpX
MAQLGLTTYRLNNNIKSTALLIGFPFLLLALLGGTVFFFALVAGPQQFDTSATSVLGTGSPIDVALSAIYAWWPIVFGIAAIWVLIGYLFNDAIIHRATGATPVSRQEQPKLYNLLENLCISRGLAVPKLYIVNTDAMNAYASGIDARTYAITVTSGLLNQLTADELEAVLAHELTHIMNRDTRLLIVTIVFVGMISFLTQLLWRSLRLVAFTRVRGKGAAPVFILVIIAAVAFVVGYLLALVLRFAISRRREFQADAGSVDLTKNPDALISGLLKIARNPDVPHVPSEVRQMFIENPPSGLDLGGLFATHPPIAKRIQILEELGGHVPSDLSSSSAAPTSTVPYSSGSPGFRSPWR